MIERMSPQRRSAAFVSPAGQALIAALALTLSACQSDGGAPSGGAGKPPAAASAAAKPTAATVAPVTAAQAVALGEKVYQANCAACHDHPETTRAPSKDNLKAMRYQFISYALTEGRMKLQGASLTQETRGALIDYLVGREAAKGEDWPTKLACDGARAKVDLSGQAPVTTFGYDRNNTRTLTAQQAGLTKAQLSNMELAWALAIPSGATMRANPAIVGKTMYLPVSDAGALYALDIGADKPCVKWTYSAGAPLRTSAAFGKIADGRDVIAFSGLDATVHVVDARSGKAIWTKNVASYSFSLTTGTPVVLADRIIVPVAQYEISVAGDNSQKCCTNHGFVLSLDPKNGAQQWRYDTMEEAKPTRDRGDGKMLYGPSGAPIWNSPSVDLKRRLVFVGTGEANSAPVSKNTDALIAIGLDDGKERWSLQATERDIFTSGCGPTPKPTQLNCEKDTVYRDVDFGASTIIAKRPDGSEVLLGGQKSGTVWALEPETGKVVWKREIGTGGPLGGVHWGIAYDGATVYAPISNAGRPLPGGPAIPPDYKPGLYAIDVKDGAVKWSYLPQADCAGDRPQRMPQCARAIGLSAAPAVIDGAVVTGALDGYLRVHNSKDGHVLWQFDTARSFTTVNGVAGAGGSIDAAAITAANGMLFVNSGYGMFGQKAGNVFLAFRPKRG